MRWILASLHLINWAHLTVSLDLYVVIRGGGTRTSGYNSLLRDSSTSLIWGEQTLVVLFACLHHMLFLFLGIFVIPVLQTSLLASYAIPSSRYANIPVPTIMHLLLSSADLLWNSTSMHIYTVKLGWHWCIFALIRIS